MIPDLNEYNIFSIRVYEADPLKGEKHEEGKRLESSNYEILNLSRNGIYGNKKQYGVPNHMQAMTVAPVRMVWWTTASLRSLMLELIRKAYIPSQLRN